MGRKISMVLLGVLLMGSFADLARGQSKPTGTVKIGIIQPLSGPYAKLGEECLVGAEIARDLINERGGLWGKKVEYVVGDAPTPAAATTEAERLITQYDVKLLMGVYGSSLAIAASAVIIKHGLVYFEIDSASPMITGRGYPYIFRNHVGSPHIAEAPMQFIKEYLAPALKIDSKNLRVASLAEDSAYGSSEVPYLKEYAQKYGLNLLGIEMYSAKSTDLSSIVLRIKELKPDVVIGCSYLNDAILFQRQSKQLGLYAKAMIGLTAGYDMPETAEALGNNINGIFSSTGSLELNPQGLLPETRELVKELKSRFEKRTGRIPVSHAGWAFNGAWLVMHDILPKAGSFDPQKIRDVVMSLDAPIGSTVMGYGIKFPADGWGQRVSCIIGQWQNGKQVVVWPERFGTAKPIMVPLPAWDKR